MCIRVADWLVGNSREFVWAFLIGWLETRLSVKRETRILSGLVFEEETLKLTFGENDDGP